MRRMKKFGMLAATVMLALVATTGCGKSESQKKAEEAQKHLEEAAKQMEAASKQSGAAATESATKGLEALAKGLGGLAGAATGADGKPVEPVSFRSLQTVFVPLDGWEMSKPTGEKMSSPVSYSQAKVRYHKGDASIEVSVMDSAFNQLLVIPFSAFLTAGYEKETEDGYEKSVKVAGNPGWEKWSTNAKNGELNAFVNKRFVVQIEGRHVDDTKTLYQLADAMPLSKLVDLK
jgi:hypothetical protein